jgi:plastocyanin
MSYWLAAIRYRMAVGRRVAAGLAAVVLGLGLSSGCFSEHEATEAVEGVCSIDVGEGVPGSTLIVIRQFSFGPTEVRVRAGDRITWINCEEEAHTSTAEGGEWASPLLATGDGFTQTFPTAGEFPYFCEPHPFMTGRVIVE